MTLSGSLSVFFIPVTDGTGYTLLPGDSKDHPVEPLSATDDGWVN